MNLATHYLEEALHQMKGHKRLADGALQQVTDEEFFRELDPESNSIAVIVKHMAGNMRSRFTDFLTNDGEKPDRNRDQEFELGMEASRKDLMRAWEQGWKIVFDSIGALKPEDVEKTITIRREPHTVFQAVNRAIAHLAQHTGDCLPGEILSLRQLENFERAAREERGIQREDAWQTCSENLERLL